MTDLVYQSAFARVARIRFLVLRREERGSAAIELTLVAPLLILLLLFIVLCGRLAETKLRINDVVHQAARAATLARTSSQAVANAEATANAALASAGSSCQALSVSTDVNGFKPGSTVTVTVSCSVGLSDLTALGVPGTRTFNSSFSSPVDVWRGAPSLNRTGDV